MFWTRSSTLPARLSSPPITLDRATRMVDISSAGSLAWARSSLAKTDEHFFSPYSNVSSTDLYALTNLRKPLIWAAPCPWYA
jgi:hypothetical protein